MNQSPEVGELFAALAAVQQQIRAAEKNAQNPHLRNRYADLGSIWDAWQQHGPAAGLAIIQAPTPDGTLRTILGHASGQWIASDTPILAGAGKGVNEAQAYGSALTYARRYALAAIVGIYAGDDDDAAGAGSPGKQRQQQPAPQQDAPDPMTQKLKAMFATMSAKGLDKEAFRAALKARYNHDSSKQLTPNQYSEVMRDLEGFVIWGADILADQARAEEAGA